MKAKTIISTICMLAILALCIAGCRCVATLTMEEDYNVRIVNRSGETVKFRWDGDTYRYLDDDCTIYIYSVDGGYHELEWGEEEHSRSHTRPKQVYKLELEADIDIVFQDDPDETIIIIDR